MNVHIFVMFFTDSKRDVRVIVTVTVIIGTIVIALCLYFLRRWTSKQRGNLLMYNSVVSS